ncbi:hypothetical protein [Rhizobium laguerreae]|uniref:hypothetical protein n=1 Tax=Rhizobium laguerreae TaxID=1076926 RepID=UPI00140526BB|nr:hypothetical protein [Rhizobium laguerreae]
MIVALVAETPSAIASRLRSLSGRYDQAACAAAPFEIINKADFAKLLQTSNFSLAS